MTSENKPDHLINAPGPRKSTDPVETPWLRPQSEPVEFKQEHQNVPPLSKEEVEDEVLEAVEEGKEKAEVEATAGKTLEVKGKVEVTVEKTKAQRIKDNRVLVNQLRQADDDHNRTCGLCLKRKPIDDFARLKLSQVCTDCE